MFTSIRRSALLPAVLATLVGLGFQAAPANAQLARTFVSAARGNDANDCNRPTPCRTFQAAHDKTLDQGEITVLDTGGYGAVTITKSISIVNDGVGEASILVSGGATGIEVRAPAAGHVSLRGLTIQGIGFGGGTGIYYFTGASLTITRCVVRNLTLDGIHLQPGVSGSYHLSMSDTVVADNGTYGIAIFAYNNSTIRASLTRVQLTNNYDGLIVHGRDSAGSINVTVTDSVSADNARHGFIVTARTAGAPTSLTVVRSVVAHNGVAGLYVDEDAAASLRIGGSTITGNDVTRLRTGTAVLQSFGDNLIAGNHDSNPALPTIPMK
jgi:hypothetical protein